MIDTPACDIQIAIPPRPSWLKRKPTRTTEAAERAARKYNVAPADVLALMPEALGLIRRDAELRELARGRARQLTSLDARIIASRENKYLDHSTHPRFDETSRELAAEFPELGFDPDGHDTPARVWAFIREGKQPIPVRHSDCVAELAAQWCEQLETEDFPDDADGFDPSSWDETATPPESQQPEGANHDLQNPRHHLLLPSPWTRPSCRDGSRRETPRPHLSCPTMSEVRSERIARPLVRPEGVESGPSVDPIATPRLRRAAGYNPAYVAGNGLPAFIRARDGPRMIRHALPVV
jgi:hypothetical protein